MKITNEFSKQIQFRMDIGAKTMAFSMLLFLILIVIFKVTLDYNYFFFQADDNFKNLGLGEVFYSTALKDLTDYILYIVLYLIGLFITGFLFAGRLLKPFKDISHKCQQLEEKNLEASFERIDEINSPTLSLMNFTQQLFIRKLKGKEVKEEHLNQIRSIRSHRLEFVLVIELAVFALLISLCSGAFMSHLLSVSYVEMVNLATETLKVNESGVRLFFQSQESLFNFLSLFFLVLLFIGNSLLMIHVYGKIAAPLFAYFATMRAIIRGKLSNRVHLLGYEYIRDESRVFNKFLDWYVRKKELELENN